eukprot:7140343-Prorocentrum_lima.AAC.1
MARFLWVRDRMKVGVFCDQCAARLEGTATPDAAPELGLGLKCFGSGSRFGSFGFGLASLGLGLGLGLGLEFGSFGVGLA